MKYTITALRRGKTIEIERTFGPKLIDFLNDLRKNGWAVNVHPVRRMDHV